MATATLPNERGPLVTAWGKWSSRYYLTGFLVVLLGAMLTAYTVFDGDPASANAVNGWYLLATTYLGGAGVRSAMERRKEYIEAMKELKRLEEEAEVIEHGPAEPVA